MKLKKALAMLLGICILTFSVMIPVYAATSSDDTPTLPIVYRPFDFGSVITAANVNFPDSSTIVDATSAIANSSWYVAQKTGDSWNTLNFVKKTDDGWYYIYSDTNGNWYGSAGIPWADGCYFYQLNCDPGNNSQMALAFNIPYTGKYSISSEDDFPNFSFIYDAVPANASVNMTITENGQKIWPTDKDSYTFVNKPDGTNNAQFPTIDNLDLTAGQVLRIEFSGFANNGAYGDIKFAPKLTLNSTTNGTSSAASSDTSSSTSSSTASSGYQTKEYDAASSIINFITTQANGTKNAATNLNDDVISSTPWQFQYTYDGIQNDKGITHTWVVPHTVNWEFDQNYNWNGYAWEDSGCPSSTTEWYSSGNAVGLDPTLMSGSNSIASLAFVAPEDGTYTFSTDPTMPQIAMYNSSYNGATNPISLWIEKGNMDKAKQVWPGDGTKAQIGKSLNKQGIDFPTLSPIAMKKGDVVRFCVQGNIDNTGNNTAMAPIATKTGDYNASLDPNPNPGTNDNGGNNNSSSSADNGGNSDSTTTDDLPTAPLDILNTNPSDVLATVSGSSVLVQWKEYNSTNYKVYVWDESGSNAVLDSYYDAGSVNSYNVNGLSDGKYLIQVVGYNAQDTINTVYKGIEVNIGSNNTESTTSTNPYTGSSPLSIGIFILLGASGAVLIGLATKKRIIDRKS